MGGAPRARRLRILARCRASSTCTIGPRRAAPCAAWRCSIGALDAAWDAHVLVPDGPAATVLADAGATVHPGPVPAFTHTWDVQYHGLRWLVLARELVSLPGHLRRLGALLDTLRPDIVHLNDSVLLASGRLAHRRGAKVVWHLRSSLAHGGRDRRSRWIVAAPRRVGRRRDRDRRRRRADVPAPPADRDRAEPGRRRARSPPVPRRCSVCPRAGRGRLLRLPAAAEGLAGARRGDAAPGRCRRAGPGRRRGRRRAAA